jgi:hypothetical protein
MKNLKNLKTFEEFINESALNEASLYTIDKYIKDSKGDDFWIDIANKVVKLMKLPANQIVWVTSDDDDDNWESIEDYWNDNAKPDNVADDMLGDEDGTFYFDKKIPMGQYEESGISAYMIPVKVYKTL